MNLDIIFLSLHGEPLTPQEAEQETHYDKLTYSSGNLKFIEHYKPNRKACTYFLSAEEDKKVVTQKIIGGDYHRLILCFNKEGTGDYTLWDYEEISKDGKLLYCGKKTIDRTDRAIMYCDVDIDTGEVKRVKKYYYGFPEEGNTYGPPKESGIESLLLTFEYSPNGNVSLITDHILNFGYMWPITLEKFLADTQFSQNDFPWKEHPYYHFAHPLLPEGQL